jgi:hypothetical protein
MRKHAYSYPFVLAVVLAALFVATNGRAATQPSWAEVSSFYSGGNFTGPIDCTWTNSNGTTGFAGSGHIALNPQVCKSLAARPPLSPDLPEATAWKGRASLRGRSPQLPRAARGGARFDSLLVGAGAGTVTGLQGHPSKLSLPHRLLVER